MVTPVNTITDVLNQWAAMGIFAYVLPFLMIFAVIFGILSKTKILGPNKAVQGLIAFSIGLMALQFDYVSSFFATLFPYTGMGISILLVALILLGLFAGGQDGVTWVKYVWLAIGLVIFVAIFLMTLSDLTFLGVKGAVLAQSWPALLAGIVVIGFMFWVMSSGKEEKEK
ncbi:MAG: hypothetical protein PHF67_05150 [Candidatus Nanoarchaeia archaeon]|nr:hypothetical protein [Candidatus Nanoarchaeia archaeon]